MNTSATVLNQSAFRTVVDGEPEAVPHSAESSGFVPHAAKSTPTLKDLLEDGVYLLFLLQGKNPPASAVDFNRRIDQYLATFDRVCKTFDKPLDAVMQSKYAFCALLDEIILSSGMPIRDDWESAPLQLRLFGEHLAGEGFFERLEKLRQNPTVNIELLEVFHTCLLLGFQGKYLLEGSEKLNYLVARLGQEIASVRGPSRGFAPNWKLPLKFNEYVRHELPMWLFYALMTMAAVAVFLLFQWRLNTQMNDFYDGTGSEFGAQANVPESPLLQSATPAAEPVKPGEQAAAVDQAKTQNYQALNRAQDSEAVSNAEEALKREAEQEAAYLRSSAGSRAGSAVRSLYR